MQRFLTAFSVLLAGLLTPRFAAATEVDLVATDIQLTHITGYIYDTTVTWKANLFGQGEHAVDIAVYIQGELFNVTESIIGGGDDCPNPCSDNVNCSVEVNGLPRFGQCRSSATGCHCDLSIIWVEPCDIAFPGWPITVVLDPFNRVAETDETNNTLTVIAPNPCPGDLNYDGAVAIDDVAVMLASFGETNAMPEQGDLDLDHDVDITDLALILSVFGSFCP